VINHSLEVSTDCAEYSAADFGKRVALIRNGFAARRIVLKEAGSLRAYNADGVEYWITGLPALYVHDCNASALHPLQATPLIVYW
jgi:hypothetical protein